MSLFYWTAFNQKVFRGFSIVSVSVVRAENFHDSYHRKDASSQIASGNQHTNRMVLFQPHWLSQTLPEIFDKKLGKWYKLIGLCRPNRTSVQFVMGCIWSPAAHVKTLFTSSRTFRWSNWKFSLNNKLYSFEWTFTSCPDAYNLLVAGLRSY